MKTKILLIALIIGLFYQLGYSQTILVDFGTTNSSTASPTYWNNFSATTDGVSLALKDNLGNNTTVNLVNTKALLYTFATGTNAPTAPASSIFPGTATVDGLYRSDGTKPILTFTGLDISKKYTFDIFASRVGDASKTRTTKYTLTGNASSITSLDATENTGSYATFSTMSPDNSGNISLMIEIGSPNTAFVAYINAMRITLVDPNTASSDYFRTSTSGTWSSSSTWQSSHDNTNWFSATASPTSAATAVTIQNGHTIAVDANTTTTSLTLNTGSALTVNPGKQLTVSTTLVNNGTLNLNSDASNGTATIITPSSVSGSGNVNVQQHLTTGRNWYVSSPVSAATSGVITTAGNSLWSYDELNTGNVLWNSITATNVTLNPMQGYVTSELANGVVTFTGGSLNNGNMSVVLNRTENGKTNRGYNLVGNPYPSYLDWTQASANSTNLGTSMWYRTKSPGYVFATYNASGGTGTNGATRYIPPMQAFWVYVKPALDLSTTTGTLALTNLMRSHESGTNRLKVQSSIKDSQKLLRLQVSDGTYTDETVIYFNSDAKDLFDSYDSPKRFNGNPIPDIYSVTDSQNLAINGYNELKPNQQVCLGLRTINTGLVTIRATDINNFGTDTKVILKDKILNSEFDLTDGNAYVLTNDINSSDTSRLSVVFKTREVINSISDANMFGKIQIYTDGTKQVVVNLNNETNSKYSVRVLNMLGVCIESKQLTNNVNVLGNFPIGVYFVEICYAGKSMIKKVVIH